jgi:hypothetical protein
MVTIWGLFQAPHYFFSMILCPFLCSSPEFLLITLFLVVFHDFIYYNLPLKFNGVPFESGIKCSQEEFWFRSWYNSPCWFCNQVKRTMWNLWKTCFLHLKKDRGDTDRTDWWGWCLYACMSTALCQRTSCCGSCKNGPGISEGSVWLLSVAQLFLLSQYADFAIVLPVGAIYSELNC